MNPTDRSDSSIPFLVLVILAFILLWAIYPQEFVTSDPWAYSSRAFKISDSGDFGGGHIFDQRIAVTVPTAFAYKLFGVNIHTTNLLPLISSILIILVVWLALPDRKSRVVGAVLCLTSVPLLASSVLLFPDIVATAFMAASFLMLLNRDRVVQGTGGWMRFGLAPIAVGLLFVSFLAKMSAYWVLPLWGWALTNDLKSAHQRTELLRRFYLPALCVGIGLGILYLLFCTFIWDDPFARLRSIEALNDKHLWTNSFTSKVDMSRRLTFLPILLIVKQYGVPILALALLAPAISPPSIRPWAYYALCCLFFFWFGSTSFTRYVPMSLYNRMTLPILPALYILAGYLTSRLSISTNSRASVKSLLPILFVFSLTSTSFMKYINSWSWKNLHEVKAISIVRQEVEKHPDKGYYLICSDNRSPKSLAFYFGYQYPDNLSATFAAQLPMPFAQNSRIYFYVNKKRSRWLYSAYGDRNFDTEIETLGLPIAYSSDSHFLFESDDAERIKRLWKVRDIQ